MGVIKLNPDNLKKKIKGLRNKADEAGRARASIDAESENLGDPSPSMAVEKFRSDSATHIDNVRACADHIETEMNRIIELNENGIATKSSGVITVENVPDAVLQGGANEFNNWSQGVLDGKDAQTLANGGTPKSGRTSSDIQASMEANKNSSSYSTAFIDELGPENITKLPVVLTTTQQKKEDGINVHVASTLGTILASASSTWSSEKAKEVSDAIVETVNGGGDSKDPNKYLSIQQQETKQLVALNYILGHHDGDKDHVNDLRFGTDFLVSLAEGLEKIDPETIESNRLNAKFSDDEAYATLYDKGYSFNPMGGVLDAMGGNADAALKYLAPNGKDGNVNTSRVEKLAKYDWSWDPASFAGFTSAVASASSKRASTVEDPSGGASESERARQLSGVAIHEIAANVPEYNSDKWSWQQSDNAVAYNGDAKANLGTLLANCAPELTQAWNEGSAVDPSTGKKLPRTTEADFNALAYRVADSQDAAATIGAGLAKHATEESADQIERFKGNKTSQLEQINAAYSRGSTALNHFTAMADVKADALNAQSEKDASVRSANAAAALTGFTTVASGGLSAPFQTGTSLATTTLTTPIVTNEVFGAKRVESTMNTNPDEQMWAYAVRDAANAGLLNEEDFSVEGSDQYSWITTNNEGKHGIDLSKASQEDLKDVRSWTDTIPKHITSTIPDANEPSGQRVTPGDRSLKLLSNDFMGNSASGREDGIKDAKDRKG